MRYALVAVLALTGCPSDSTSWGGGGGGFGGGGGGGGYYNPDGGQGVYGVCQQDSDCAGYVVPGDAGSGVDAGSGSSGSDAGATGVVCARDGVCVPADDVMTVHVKWTLQSMPASTATCASSPDLELDFSGGAYGYGYAPVPCVEGEFTITKLENYYTNVSLEIEGQLGTGSNTTIPSGGGTVTLDLPY